MADMLVSPLAHRAEDLAAVGASTHGGVTIEEIVGLRQIDLRLAPDLADRLPFEVPLEPNTFLVADAVESLWLGPDEWLLVCPVDLGPAAVERVEESLAGAHHSTVDVSANRAILDIGGDGRRELLEAGCGVDLHPREWCEGRCAQTLLARVPVILQERTNATRVFVRPSFAAYFVDWCLVVVTNDAPGT